MTAIPPALRAYLSAESLQPMWQGLRQRLERTGHAIRGTVPVELDDEGADRLGGLLGRAFSAGSAVVKLADLDTALRASAAQRGLVAVVAELTGGPLRDRPAERDADQARREQLWADLDRLLVADGLASQDWTRPWTEWLHRGGVLTRLPAADAASTLAVATRILSRTLGGERPPPAGLAELASEVTGDAHGLDDGTTAAAVTLRALAFALGTPPAISAAERRLLWQRVGVSTDEISGTVITYGLRPPGTDRWAAMMRERAELGLITHLTVHELRRAGDLTRPGEVVHVCENPQVLQRLAAAGVGRPLACTSGHPAAAGMLLLSRTAVRYHGDFDWPGIAIARRIIERDAQPWRFGRADYDEAVAHLRADRRLALTGRVEPTPWDRELSPAMAAANVAVHEEAIVDLLLADVS